MNTITQHVTVTIPTVKNDSTACPKVLDLINVKVAGTIFTINVKDLVQVLLNQFKDVNCAERGNNL